MRRAGGRQGQSRPPALRRGGWPMRRALALLLLQGPSQGAPCPLPSALPLGRDSAVIRHRPREALVCVTLPSLIASVSSIELDGISLGTQIEFREKKMLENLSWVEIKSTKTPWDAM